MHNSLESDKATRIKASLWPWIREKQGRIHGRTVADGWAGAVKRKPLGIQKCDGPTDGQTDRPTDRHGKMLSRVSAAKNPRQERIEFHQSFPCPHKISFPDRGYGRQQKHLSNIENKH